LKAPHIAVNGVLEEGLQTSKLLADLNKHLIIPVPEFSRARTAFLLFATAKTPQSILLVKASALLERTRFTGAE
jgi:hypothetical protein